MIVAATATQVNDYEDGNVLTAGELNSEFGNIYTTINNLDFDNFAPGITLPPTIIDSIIAGPGLAQNPGTGALSVNVDGTSLELVTDVIGVKADGITNAEIATDAVNSDSVANNSLTANDLAANAVGTSELANNSVTSVKIQDGQVANGDLATDSVSTVKIQDGAVTRPKMVDRSVDTSSPGSNGNVVFSTQFSGPILVPASNPGGNTCTSISRDLVLTTTGSAVLLQAMPRPGSGQAWIRFSDNDQNVVIQFLVDGAPVAEWAYDWCNASFNTCLGNGSTMELAHRYFYDPGAGTQVKTYTYKIEVRNCPSSGVVPITIGNASNFAFSAVEL